MKKIYISLLCFFILATQLMGCVPPKWQKYHPNYFPDTIWATEDNSVIIEIENFGGGYRRGYINTDGCKIEVFFSLPSRPDICVKTREQIESNDGECLERWEAETPEKDKLTVTVTETTYFQVGEVLNFYLVGENMNNNDHISLDEAEKNAQESVPVKDYKQTVHFSRKETKSNNDCYVFYADSLSWKYFKKNDYWVRESVITCWIYIDAVTGELCEIKETEQKVNKTKDEAL